MKTKHNLLIGLTVMLFAVLACSMGGDNGSGNAPADAPDYQATEAALAKTQTALEAAANQAEDPEPADPQPADPDPQPADPQPADPDPDPPAVPESLSSGDILFFTDFDGPGDWEEGWIHFSIPGSNDGYSTYVENGVLYTEVPEANTTLYLVQDDYFFEDDLADVYVEAGFLNLSTHNINNVSVICRGSDKGWYEFSMLSGGLWYIWKYDAVDGRYTVINDGGIPDLDYDAPHFIGGECNGNELTIWFDGEPLRNGTVRDSTFRGGQVGVSVSTFEWENVIVEFDYFGVMVP